MAARGFFTLPGSGNDARNQESQAPCPPGYYCASGVMAPCPAGSYGAEPELSSSACSGQCSAGHFCSVNSTSAVQAPCGGVDVFCPAGSGEPQVAAPGMYTVGPTIATRNGSLPCPGGSYCTGGVQLPCAAGSFGCADRQSTPTCNGPCTAGYFCPPGSTSSQALACGGNAGQPDAAMHFCPKGSPAAQRVGTGNYSTGSADHAPHVRSGQSVCPPGYFCVDGVLVRTDHRRCGQGFCCSDACICCSHTVSPCVGMCAGPVPHWKVR
jgi:hypothetical protein